MLKYLRYNFAITVEDLNALGLGKTFNEDDVASLTEMSNAENRHVLYDIGFAASGKVLPEHFA